MIQERLSALASKRLKHQINLFKNFCDILVGPHRPFSILCHVRAVILCPYPFPAGPGRGERSLEIRSERSARRSARDDFQRDRLRFAVREIASGEGTRAV